MPELTVSMPAYNTARYVGSAIKSVLSQEGVDFELIVVDDGSSDGTAEVVRSFSDPRIRLIRNKKRMGIGYCHNLVIRESTSPFIAHVDSDDLVLPGAFAAMLKKLRSSPRIGQVHCHFFDIDAEGRTTRDALRKRREDFLRKRPPGLDYKRELLRHGTVINHLRTYRRAALQEVGGFNGGLRHGEDYWMALLVVDKYDIELVPEFLYAYRIHGGNASESLRFKNLRFWWRRYLSARELVRSGRIGFPTEKEYNLGKLMLLGLGDALGLSQVPGLVRRTLSIPRRALGVGRQRVLALLGSRLYAYAVNHLSWPVDCPGSVRGDGLPRGKQIAYYLWRFPMLSETFIQREVRALKEAGLGVHVVADAAQDVELLGPHARSLMENTEYLLPINAERLSAYKHRFLWRNPLRYLSLFLYVVLHRYTRYKTFGKDKQVFDKAVYLAGTLENRSIYHLHSPWADRCAFVSLIASRLLGVPYSVQGRAHDIHRDTHRYALPEKFQNAQFVITNTKYNASYIRTFLCEQHWHKISVIYNGVDLERLVPSPPTESISGPTLLLSVARLIPQKGLEYLLEACRILRNQGYAFRCEIIGGPEEPLYTDYHIGLKKLRNRLGLEGDVFFLGAQPFAQVLAKLRRAHIFVLPCVMAKDGSRDIIPNSLIEAMALQLPVISTFFSGIPEIVENGVSGILVPPNDGQSLADAVGRVIIDQGLRRELGENARKRVEEQFDIKKNIRHFVALFEAQRTNAR
jgi:colanic acid/amylovoran biosynthesis glycosyltransferase